MNEIKNMEEFESLVKDDKAKIFYFSGPNCNVCKVVKPQLFEMIESKFNKISIYEINTEENKEIASQNSVFAIPTLILYFQGKELLRKSRVISLHELNSELERFYDFF